MTKEKVLIQIGDVRIVRSDDKNVMLERNEWAINPKTKREKRVWKFKGFYATFSKALQAIVTKELLLNENSLDSLKAHLKQVEESNQKVSDALEG